MTLPFEWQLLIGSFVAAFCIPCSKLLLYNPLMAFIYAKERLAAERAKQRVARLKEAEAAEAKRLWRLFYGLGGQGALSGSGGSWWRRGGGADDDARGGGSSCTLGGYAARGPRSRAARIWRGFARCCGEQASRISGTSGVEKACVCRTKRHAELSQQQQQQRWQQ